MVRFNKMGWVTDLGNPTVIGETEHEGEAIGDRLSLDKES